MYKSYSKTLLIFLSLLAAVAALASDFDKKVASVILLQAKPIQKEIGLSEAQRQAMNKFADAHRAKLAAYYKTLHGNEQPDEKKLISLFETMKAGVLSQLTTSQLRRLREISLQNLDFTALADTSVADEVGLSSSQRTKIRAIVTDGVTRASKIRDSAVEQATASMRNSKPASQKDADALRAEYMRRAEAATSRVMPQLDEIKNSSRSKVMAILTPAEKSKWQALLGKPFRMD